MSSEAASASGSSGVTQPGDHVRIEYDLWAESGGKTELLDTTHEATAQEAKIPTPEGFVFGPRAHQIGGDRFPSGIENALVGIPVGDSVEREFAPADAFGERDPKLIELYSMHEIERLPEMRREDARLDIGTVLTIEGRRGRVVSMTAARVRVDFNPPFAGRKVRGTFTVLERIDDPVARVRAILDLQYGRGAEFGVDHEDGTFTLRLPERSKFDIGWLAAKPRVVDRLRTYLHPKAIRFLEEYVTPPETKDASGASPSPTETEARAGESPAASEEGASPSAPSKKSKGTSRRHASPPAAESPPSDV